MELSPFPNVAPMRPHPRRHHHEEPHAEFHAFPEVEGALTSPSHVLASGLAPAWGKPRTEPVQTVRPRVPLGMRALDEYLGGGIPAGATVAIFGPPFSGKRSMASQFLAQGLAHGQPGLLVLTDGDVAQWRQSVAVQVGRIPEERKGLACYLDLFQGGLQRPGTGPLPTPDETLAAVAEACHALPHDRRRVVFDSFSTAAALSGFPEALSTLMRVVALLRREGATNLVVVEGDAHGTLETQLIKRQCEGAIEFRHLAGQWEVQATGLGLGSPSPWFACREPGSPPSQLHFAPRPADPYTFNSV